MTSDVEKEEITGSSQYEIYTQKQIIAAFHVYDENSTGKIDIKHLPTIIRALGCVPRDKELQDFITKVEDPITKGLTKLETFLPAMKDVLLQDKWRPATKNELSKALEFFDSNGSSRLSPTFMRKLLTEHGDKLENDEVESFLKSSVNPLNNKIECSKCYELLTVPVVDILEDKRKILREIKDD